MKIVYSIGNIANAGGIERVLCSKANYLADQLNYEIHIVVSTAESVPFFSFSPKVRFCFLDIKTSPTCLPVFFSRYQKEYKEKLSAFLNTIKPDVTISFFGEDASFLWEIKDGSVKLLEFHFTKYYLKYLGESLINDYLSFIRKYWLQYLLWREERLVKKYEYVVLLTEKDKQLWGGGDKFKVIPNPLSFESKEASLLDQKTIVSIGRLVSPKGFQYLIQAFSRIEKEFPDWSVVIYGEGHDKEYLNNLIKSLSLQNKIRIESPVKDVQPVLLEGSLFVLPSRYEGFGLALTEAMECGVPCIAFDCECGPSEIIRDGEDGFVVPVNDIGALADKMKLLMHDVDLRILMGTKAKENVQRFQVEEVMEVWNAYFRWISKNKSK